MCLRSRLGWGVGVSLWVVLERYGCVWVCCRLHSDEVPPR